MKRLLILIYSLLVSASIIYAFESDTIVADSPHLKHHFGAEMRGGYVFSSSGVDMLQTVIKRSEYHSALGLHAKYSFSFGDSTLNGRMYPGAYQGLGIGLNAFCNLHEAQIPVSIYVFQGAPIKHFSKRFSIGYEWNFGASFGWEKSRYSSDITTNLVVGSKVNAMLNLAFLIDYRLSPALTLRAGVEGTHFSNGNTSLPNPGVNSLGARIGFVFTPGIDSFTDGRKKGEAEDFDSQLRGVGYDLLLYGAWRKVFIADEICKHPVPGHFGVAGVNFAPMWQFNRFFRSGVSADVQYDESSNLPAHKVDGTGYDDPKFFRQPFRECLMGGLSARAELVMPIFSVNAGIGYNLLAARCNRHTYQTLNLKMKVFRGLWLNAGYRLHSFHQPDNLVLGIGYTFR